jgi:hypothetical protein
MVPPQRLHPQRLPPRRRLLHLHLVLSMPPVHSLCYRPARPLLRRHRRVTPRLPPHRRAAHPLRHRLVTRLPLHLLLTILLPLLLPTAPLNHLSLPRPLLLLPLRLPHVLWAWTSMANVSCLPRRLMCNLLLHRPRSPKRLLR